MEEKIYPPIICTSQEETELSFHTEVPNSPRLLLAHVAQNHIWVDPLEPRCLFSAWIENSFLLYHPTFDLLYLDYVRASCLKEEHFFALFDEKQYLRKGLEICDIMPW